MKRTTRVAFSVFTSLTVHSLGFTSSALAETITVTRGPNFAAHQVKANKAPDAQALQKTPGTSVPRVVIKGSNGAAHLDQTKSVREATAQSPGHLTTSVRGPNGAAHILN